MDRIPPTATAGAPFVVDGGRWDRNPSLRLSRTGRIAVPGRTLNVADRALHLRCRVLGNIRFDASRSGRVLPPAGACYRHGFAAIARFLRATSSGNVSISLQNLLRSDLRVFFEETGVVKDWLEILGYLRKVNTCELKRILYATYLGQGVIICDKCVDRLDRKEALVHGVVLRAGVQNIRRHDSRKVVDVHLAARLLIHMRER